MKMSDIKCRKCGENCNQASKRGAYLGRVSPKGKTPVIMECVPTCHHKTGSQDDALLNAIKGE